MLQKGSVTELCPAPVQEKQKKGCDLPSKFMYLSLRIKQKTKEIMDQ